MEWKSRFVFILLHFFLLETLCAFLELQDEWKIWSQRGVATYSLFTTYSRLIKTLASIERVTGE
jgi:hypothetical protein